MDRSVNPLDNDAPSFDPPVTFVSPPDTVVSHSPDLRQSLESGRVTEDSHSTTVDSQPAPQTYLSLKDANGANVSAKRKVKQPSALVRVGSIKEPRKPEVVIESTRHSFMPELDDDDDDSEDESTSSRPLRPQRSSMDQMSNRSFIDFDQSPPRGLEDHPLNHQTPQSFLDDFSPPTSPVTADTTPKKPSSQMAARDSSPTIAQRLNTSASSNMLNISRASYAASSLSSLHVDNFPQPPEAYPLPPSVHSNASRPTLASHGSDLTQRMSRRASQPELRLRPSMAHTDSETTVFTFAPESFLDTDPSRSNLNLPNKSRSQVNDFTGESSGPSAYATAAEELNSNFDGPSSTHDNFPTDTPGVPKNQSGPPLGVAARNRDEVPRSRTWSSSFIQYWRQSLPNGDDGAEQGGRSRRSSGLWSIRTYSDPGERL